MLQAGYREKQIEQWLQDDGRRRNDGGYYLP